LGIIIALVEHLCVKTDNTRPVIDNHQSVKITDTIIHGCKVKKILRPKTVRRLHVLTSLNPRKIDQSALRCNSRNNIHSERGFVLQINVSRQHRFFILKKILGSTGAMKVWGAPSPVVVFVGPRMMTPIQIDLPLRWT
jgi:hypothetical protein